MIIAGYLANILRRINEGLITDEEAVSELADVDPESALGKALTNLMVQVATHSLLDYYLGHTRDANIIKAYFAKNTTKSTLAKLVQEINEKKPEDSDEPLLQARLYQGSLENEKDEKDLKWVVELRYVVTDFDLEQDLENIPVEVLLQGNIDPNAEKEPKAEETDSNDEEKVQ